MCQYTLTSLLGVVGGAIDLKSSTRRGSATLLQPGIKSPENHWQILGLENEVSAEQTKAAV